jgi:hypothetical protein
LSVVGRDLLTDGVLITADTRISVPLKSRLE